MVAPGRPPSRRSGTPAHRVRTDVGDRVGGIRPTGRGRAAGDRRGCPQPLRAHIRPPHHAGDAHRTPGRDRCDDEGGGQKPVPQPADGGRSSSQHLPQARCHLTQAAQSHPRPRVTRDRGSSPPRLPSALKCSMALDRASHRARRARAAFGAVRSGQAVRRRCRHERVDLRGDRDRCPRVRFAEAGPRDNLKRVGIFHPGILTIPIDFEFENCWPMSPPQARKVSCISSSQDGWRPEATARSAGEKAHGPFHRLGAHCGLLLGVRSPTLLTKMSSRPASRANRNSRLPGKPTT